MARLRGKTAVITGAGVGIGLACVTRFAAEGADVVLADPSGQGCKFLADHLKNLGLSAICMRCDVLQECEVAALMEATVQRFGKIDVLVNNAGIESYGGPAHAGDAVEWARMQNVNLTGVQLCTRHAAPMMRAKRGGSIINVAWITGASHGCDSPPMHASHGAVRKQTESDAMEYSADGVRVNSIHPGYIRTPLCEHHLLGEPDDIAWGAVYLASDESRFVSGSALVIDGGYTARRIPAT